MAPVRVERIGAVAVLTMHHGRANALDPELCKALIDALAELEQSSSRAVVLTGTGPVFCAGADLVQVLDGGTAYLDAFLPALSDALLALFRFPKPVVAAVNGHAIAGGCVLVCACDRRLIALGRARIGVPELLVGVSFPLVGLEILRFGTSGQGLQELIYTGATLEAPDAGRRGLVEEAVPADDLLERAVEIAERLGQIPAEAFRSTKDQLRQPTLDRIERERPSRDAETASIWASPDVRAAMARYAEQNLGKRTP